MNIIEQLEQLNLSDYPIAEIDRLLTSLEEIMFMTYDFHAPNNSQVPIWIVRAVNNTREEPEFNSIARISFKPSAYNNSYLRASTPKNTMFYGSMILPEDFYMNQFKSFQIVASTEVSSLIKNSEILEGLSRITFGKWEIVNKLSLVTIIDPNLNYDHTYLNNLKEKYIELLNNRPIEIKQKTLRCLEFLSSEFSKYVSNGNNHEYLISSKFTEIFTKSSSSDGIIYPSVQSKGFGLCVAIHPRAMNKLKLTYVLQSKIKKSISDDGDFLIEIEEEKNCHLTDRADKFELKEIAKK